VVIAKDGQLFNSLELWGIQSPKTPCYMTQSTMTPTMAPANAHKDIPGFPGDPRGWEQTKYGTAELSPLGRKLLGLDRL
jgi:hypothetical protein